MQTRQLDERERLAIESILDDAEKYFTKGAISRNIEELDEQCKSIWADWEYSVHPVRTSPEKSKQVSPRIKQDVVSKSVSPRVLDLSSDDSSESESVETEHHSAVSKEDEKMDTESDTDEISEEEVLPPRNRSLDKKKKTTFQSAASRTATRTTAQPVSARGTKKPVRKAAAPMPSGGPVQPFSRSDAARLRQDNIELRNQVSKLQAALDRSNLENARLKEEIQRMKLDQQKQKSMISFLKEDRIYKRK